MARSKLAQFEDVIFRLWLHQSGNAQMIAELKKLGLSTTRQTVARFIKNRLADWHVEIERLLQAGGQKHKQGVKRAAPAAVLPARDQQGEQEQGSLFKNIDRYGVQGDK